MRREKFISLAESRTNNAIKQLKLIGNLANTNSYEYREEEIEKIFSCLNQELKRSRARFQASINEEDRNGFRLSS